MAGMLKIAAAVVAFTLILAVLFQPEVPISGKKLILGTKGYDMKAVTAPVADGALLKIITYVLTRTPFGPALRRKLLNDNDVAMIRELGAQVTTPPLYFPMKRIGSNLEDEPIVDQHTVLQSGVPAATNGLKEAVRSDGDFVPRSVMEYAQAYRAGVKPSDVMKSTLKATHAWEKEGFHIFSSLIDDDVLQQAYASDARFAANQPLSILDGVPIAFKDFMEIIGHSTYNGYTTDPAFKEYWVAENSRVDDTMVARFRAQGAIIYGLTIMVEGGVSPLGYNSHFQGPFNPFSWYRYSGGSSSGSAVAVATGLVPVAIGLDGGGSVRIPSAMSGVHGLATTFGRCPFDKDFAGVNTKPGPMTASSEDALIAMSVMAETDLNHFYSQLYDGGLRGPPPFTVYDYNINPAMDVKGMRIGIYAEWFDDSAPTVRARCHEVVSFLQEMGVEVVPIDIPHLQVMSLAHGLKLSSEMAQDWDKIYYSAPTSMEQNTRVLLGLGLSSSAVEILAGEKLKGWAANYLEGLYSKYHLDAIVTPMVGIEVPVMADSVRPIGESNTGLVVDTMKFAVLANFLGLPGYSVPVGNVRPAVRYEKEPADVTVPVGLQLIGQPWTEHKV